MSRYRGLLTLGGLLVALACDGRQAEPPVARSAVSDPSWAVSLTSDRPVYVRGEDVTLTLVARNATAASQTLEFSSGQRYDFAIEDARAPVWRWSASQAFIQMLGEETVAPGDSLVYRERFNGELPAGRYRAEGIVTRMGDALRATAEFEIR